MLKTKTFSILAVTAVILLTIPTFWSMLKFGIYTMHDFHVFRAFEFHKCIADLQIPCRWAPDSGFEYGEPMFNFYGQLSYFPTEIVHLLGGLSIINSVKITFIFSLAGSAVAMFFFSKQLWKSNLAAVTSAVLYVYAPYRAVDVWVRGALPEALAFVLYPIIFYFLNNFFETERKRDLIFFSLTIAGLIILHNLSFLMFLLPLTVWTIYLFAKTKKFYLFKNLIGAGVLTFLLSAFYLLPVAIEGKLINLGKTVQGYYDFKFHFANLFQLLFSQKWGYGASVAGFDDNLSFAAGLVQWMLSILAIMVVLVSKKLRENFSILILAASGWLSLFLVHQRSTFIWEIIRPLQYLQFPWRFLAISIFSFSAAAGSLILFLKNSVVKVLVVVAIVSVVIFTNFGNYHEDIWRPISDEAQFAGGLWTEQTASAVNDFWPAFGTKIPSEPAKEKVVFLQGSGEILNFVKTSNTVRAKIEATDPAKVQLASVYFPGWIGFIDLQRTQVGPSGELGLSTVSVPAGTHEILLRFTDTPVRIIGNILTLVGIGIVITLLIKRHKNVRKSN